MNKGEIFLSIQQINDVKHDLEAFAQLFDYLDKETKLDIIIQQISRLDSSIRIEGKLLGEKKEGE